jgi:hypothetical protein
MRERERDFEKSKVNWTQKNSKSRETGGCQVE